MRKSCSSFVPIEETESSTCERIERVISGCSSFVPIEETERRENWAVRTWGRSVAVRSFRLRKLKDRNLFHDHFRRFGCSSFVPIEETERLLNAANPCRDGSSVAVRSFRLRKLKDSGRGSRVPAQGCCSSFVPIEETESCPMSGSRHALRMLQFVRSD